MADTKMEDELNIKPDPDFETPAPLIDDFDYEDTGELQILKEQMQAWLLRLPKVLYDKWAGVSDDQPIQLGYVRQFKNSSKFQLHLDPTLPQSQGMAKRYEMRTTGQDVHNTFIFSEKDLPGFKTKGRNKGNFSGIRGDRSGFNRDKVDKNSRYQGFMRRAIPKETVLSATIKKDVTCIPIDTEATTRQQRLDVEQGKGAMTILKGDIRQFANLILDPDGGKGVKSRANFDNFKTEIVSAKAKTQENKTARMPQNELLDQLYDCFTKYRYWSMGAFRKALKQPESYLRATLPLIADQIKSGPFNNHWKLKPEAEPQNLELAAKEESAPQREGEGDGEGEGEGASSAAESGIGEEGEDDDDDNEEDLQMEDVGL